MYFSDRITLGNTLANELERFRGKDAVIICLKETSLLTCLAMARWLRAWVYPLIFAPIYSNNDQHTAIGALSQDGEFCLNPDIPEDERESMSTVATDLVEQQKQTAMEAMHRTITNYGVALDKHRMDGRDVIIAGDIITSLLAPTMAQQLLESVTPSSITAVAGNVTPAVAELLRRIAIDTATLDVVTGIIENDDQYFEYPDTYTTEQKYKLVHHISTYWQ